MKSMLKFLANRISECNFHTSSIFLRKGRVVQLTGGKRSSTIEEKSSSNFSAEFRGSTSSLTESTPAVSAVESGAHRRKTPGSLRPNSGSANEEFQKKLMDVENVPRYDKAEASDRRLGRAMMLSRSRKFREQKGKVILEGRRLIMDALEAGAQADTIFFSQVSNIEGLPLQGSKVNLVKVAYKDIKLWSELSTPQGIVGVFRQPKYDNLHLEGIETEQRLPVTLICDNIRDPGNLGTILRSAAAAACSKVLVSKGCVDVWEPKVLRSGTGAHFRIPVLANLPWNSLPNYLDEGCAVHIADCNNVLCHEASHLHYPMDGDASSVHNGDNNSTSFQSEMHDFEFDEENMYEKDDPRPSSYFGSSSKDGKHERYSKKDLSSSENRSTRSRAVPQDDDKLQSEHIQRTVPYFGVNWNSGPCALIVGGETEGLSSDAEELCSHTGGRRVHVPMSFGVDSLNAAMATSIILFEAKRQLLMSTVSGA